MDTSTEILSELRLLRVDMARVEVKLQGLEDHAAERKVGLTALQLRIRTLEQGRVSSLVGAAGGGGGVAVLVQWILSQMS